MDFIKIFRILQIIEKTCVPAQALLLQARRKQWFQKTRIKTMIKSCSESYNTILRFIQN